MTGALETPSLRPRPEGGLRCYPLASVDRQVDGRGGNRAAASCLQSGGAEPFVTPREQRGQPFRHDQVVALAFNFHRHGHIYITIDVVGRKTLRRFNLHYIKIVVIYVPVRRMGMGVLWF